jgi:hypothetical protein
MTLHQTLKAAPAKTNDLLARLAETSNTAVKSREKLLADLSTELQLYIDLESRHLVPVLRKHDETKALAADAVGGAKALRAKLAELEAAPKDGDAFLEKLGDLRQSFEQHLRDERKELLPAIAKVLETEEADRLAAGIEAGIADAENAKRDEAKQARAARDAEKREREAADAAAEQRKRDEAKQAREAAKQAREAEEAEAEAERAVVRAQKAAARAAREAVDEAANVVQLEAATAQDAGRQVAQTVAGRIERATTSVGGALDTYRSAAQSTAEDLRAVTAASSLSARGLAEIGSAWSDWLSKAARTNAEATQRLLRCRTLQQVAEAQSEFGSSVMRNWMEANALMLQAAQQSARKALKPLDGRLDPGA